VLTSLPDKYRRQPLDASSVLFQAFGRQTQQLQLPQIHTFAMSPQGSIFRIFNPASQSKEEAVQKRQEQLRRAQRSVHSSYFRWLAGMAISTPHVPTNTVRVYRQRKTRYVKNLERDVACSRERECHWLAEKSALEDEVRGLLRLLDQHGIATPSASSLAGGSPRQLLTSPLSSNTCVSQDEHPEWPRASSLPLSSFDFQSPPETATSPRVCEMDHSILGMEFVLKYVPPRNSYSVYYSC
jgi:hypothetical protein